MTPPEYELRQIHCSGSPLDLGLAQGEEVRDSIGDFVAQRLAALDVYLAERGPSGANGIASFVELGRQCLAMAERWDVDGWTEHCAIARAASVDAALLYAVANMTDVRDVLLCGAPAPGGAEGCSSFMLPPHIAASGSLIAGQTWDLNPSDLNYVIAVHRKPTHGPETWSITCVGCLTLMGMNALGLALGTTNIKTKGSRGGVCYLSLLHRAVGVASRTEAAALIESAPRAAGHTYWFADETGGTELECSAESCRRRELERTALVRTNHCLSEALVGIEAEAVSTSSAKRLARLEAALGEGRHDFQSIQELYTDRSDGIDSICRYPEDQQGTATNACLICVPSQRRLWACRGPADRGKWYELTFDS